MSSLATMSKLISIQGIDSEYEQLLRSIGIRSKQKLIEKGSNKYGRKIISKETGISDSLVLKWVTLIDIERIKGIGPEYAELLELCGVDTVPSLARRNARNLLEKMTEVNSKWQIVKKLPTQVQLEGWIEQSKILPRAVFY